MGSSSSDARLASAEASSGTEGDPKQGHAVRRRLGLFRAVQRFNVETFARVAFVAICVILLVGFFVYPLYPTFDAYFALLWGRDVLHLQMPVFDGWRYPTEHPLAILLGGLLSLFGHSGDRLWTAMSLVAYTSMLWGVYRLARGAFTPLIGVIASALLLANVNFLFLAIRGYIDVIYMALIIWAGVLENERPRRGTPVFLLLLAAGLIRPEGWVLAGLYWLWMAWKASWSERIRYAALVALAPLIWAGVDYAVTGDPLFSIHFTSSVAESVGRHRELSEIPMTVPHFLVAIMGLPMLVVGTAGLLVAAVVAPRRAIMPFIVFATGVATYLLIAAGGSSIIWRYVIVPALALFIFAAVTMGGFSMLRPGSWARRAWLVGGVAMMAVGLFSFGKSLDPSFWDQEFRFRGNSHADLVKVLSTPEVKAGLKCGPISVPSHKLVPDVRWMLDIPDSRIVPRGAKAKTPNRGVAIFVNDRTAMMRQALGDRLYPAIIEAPTPSFRRAVTSEYYAAYVACPNSSQPQRSE